MDYYKIMKLDAAVVLAEGKEVKSESETAWAFEIDLNNEFLRTKAVISIENQADCALFRQIILAAGNTDTSDNRALIDKIVYLDFNNVFKDKRDYRDPMLRFLSKVDSAKWQDEIDRYGEALMENGILLKMQGRENNDGTIFYPFDKSGNMSRHGVITFISEEVYKEVDERVRLGIDFNDIPVVPSKYFSYRGLYLSDGKLISNLELDKEKVIVIDDDFNKVTADVVTLRTDEDGKLPVNCDGSLSLTDESGKVTVIKAKEISMNSFDGEGIISAEYATMICDELPGNDDIGSFQIRMPFVKGVLHSVDFKRFIIEQLGLDELDGIMIRDTFGIERDLSKVEIMLTRSMFKCAEWIEEKSDPMELYFERHKKYDHVLYITNTSRGFGNTDEVKLNYQFLNTIAFEKDELRSIVGKHYKEARDIARDPVKGRKAVFRRQDESWQDDNAGYDDESMDDDGINMPAWKYALLRNPLFAYDPYIKNMLNDMSKSMMKDGRKGQIYVEGTLGFLSRDLLSFMIHVIRQVEVVETEKTIEHLIPQCFGENQFYIPGYDGNKAEKDIYCGILRSPHLSRNEQCALSQFCPDRDSLYERYFGHLSGVIMVPYDSIVPAALGGADFDGDLVKVIKDNIVNKAILRGAYDTYDEHAYTRKYPVSEIPSPPGSKEKAVGRISFNQLRRTFSNSVGHISNTSLMMNKHEYWNASPNDEYENWSALCTIAVGLEIDSVKTGVRPDLRRIEEKAGNDTDTFLKIKYALKDKYTEETPYDDDIPTYLAEGVRPIDLLEYYYQSESNSEDSKKSAKITQKEARIRMFCGLSDIKNIIDEKPIEDFKRIKESYLKFQRKRGMLASEIKKHTGDTYIRQIVNLLNTEYDTSVDKFARNRTDLIKALHATIAECAAQFDNLAKIGSALQNLKENWRKWIFADGYEEKKRVLSSFLDTEELSDTAVDVLCDSYDNGYHILKFVLHHIYATLLTEQENSKQRESLKAKKSVESGENFDLDLYNQMCDAYDFNEPLSAWERDAKRLCRKRIADLFDGDMKKAAMCWLNNDSIIDKEHKFLWKWFGSEDLRDFIADGSGSDWEAENA